MTENFGDTVVSKESMYFPSNSLGVGHIIILLNIIHDEKQ